ncbi:MAG: uracil-DNA glycosylase [Comamonadaceae bacterium]|nr:uracil-DNA glycosylase [Comamonadaceae bacterium]
MSLNLDDRQRAMLAEMGVRVWWPLPATELVPPAAQTRVAATRQGAIKTEVTSAYSERATSQNDSIFSAKPMAAPATIAAGVHLQAQQTAVPVNPGTTPKPAALLPLADGIAGMDGPALTQSVASCQACRMCLGRQAPVFELPPEPQRCDWMVLGEPPDDAQERAGKPFVGDSGKLLHNMLRAVGVKRFESAMASGAVPDPAATGSTSVPAHTAYLSLALKCRPALPTMPDAAALAACAHYLRREIALLQPKVILTMGRFAMQMLLCEAHPDGLKLPLGKLRGQVWRFQGVPVVVTYPPEYLLRSGHDKARAWEDLCLAADVVQGAPSA